MTEILTEMRGYKAFGLGLSSSIPLPELPSISEGTGTDVVIEVADLSKLWSKVVSQKKRFLVEKDLVIFQIPNTATFCVEAGKRIIVSPVKAADQDQIRLYILGTCMGALLMQRKILPLHGSAIAINGKAYGFIGDSGVGKSTLALALLNRGYRLLTDDLIAVSLYDDNTPYVMPAYPQQKLWQETLDQFGMESGTYRPIFKRENKFTIPMSSMFWAEPIQLAGVFEIVSGENDLVEISCIQKRDCLQKLFLHTYRNFIISHSGLMEWHFNIMVNLVNSIRVFQLRRPVSTFTADHLASRVLNEVQKEV